MRNRIIKQVFRARNVNDGTTQIWRALPHRDRFAIGPYVFVDHYQHEGDHGIGDTPHPHAGIEVISYLLSGNIEHRDSSGTVGKMGAFDAQYINAGRGIIHAEQPRGGRHGLQLWISLPANKKMMTPSYSNYSKDQIPHFNKGGATVRVIAGKIGEHQGPVKTQTHNLFAHISLPANTSIILDIDKQAAEELGLYVMVGKLVVSDGQTLSADGIALLSDGDSVHLTAGDCDVELVLLGGEVLNDPIIFDGPFVMDTHERIAQAYHDYHNGKMGYPN